MLLTGGMVVQADTYNNTIFKDSLRRLFLKDGEEGFLGTSSNATLEVRNCGSVGRLCLHAACMGWGTAHWPITNLSGLRLPARQ